MLSFFLPYAIITIIILFALISIFDIRSIFYLILFFLFIEFTISLLSQVYLSSIGYFYFCNLGKVINLPNNFNINLVLIYDDISFFFHVILFVALFVCFIFLMQYFEYDINSKSIVLLSSIFSQLAFIYFLTFDLFLIIFF